MKTLTNSQRRAVESDAPSILLVAGPGSGKTATKVQRIWRRIQGGADPAKFAVVSFTNAAAKEIEERISRECPECFGTKVVREDCEPSYERPCMTCATGLRFGHVGTLHSLALKMLKRYGGPIGYGDRIALIGEDAAKDLLARKAKQLGCKTKLDTILEIKARGADGTKRTKSSLPLEQIVIAAYYSDLREAGLVDFETILTEFARMIEAGLFPADVFSDLYVDEVQDSGALDWRIYAALPVANKWLVGDPDQSIYAFRGGCPDLMRQWSPVGLETICLEENFRSHTEICEAAQRLIEWNTDRFAKETISVKGPGGVVVISEPYANEGAEVGAVVENVLARIKATEAKEIAILTRTNALAHEFRQTLRAANVPLAEERKNELPKDWPLAKALIDLMVNPENDTLAYFVRVMLHRQNAGSDAEAMRWANDDAREAASGMVSINRAFDMIRAGESGAELLLRYNVSMESRMKVGEVMRTLNPDDDMLALALGLSTVEGDVTEATEGVAVTTLHGAKGREWDVVFLVGFEDESIPGKREPVEEARRLAYVGVTRARRTLYVTHARTRKTSWGAIEARTPSRFIKEMGMA